MIKNRCDFLEAENQQNLHQRIAEIREKIEIAALKSGRSKDEITLMAVTKTVPPERVNEALKAGISLLGENRVQEFNEKEQFYQCKREKIHFIGHLQTNKIRDIIEKVGMIQSVDSIHLARAISKECEKRQSEMDI
ncbi:MAG: YggS family pyridoxal phosphate-dependent enzyme, partial [Oscillospiraceae bacterium]